MRSAFLYQDPVRKAIRLTKFSGQTRRADWLGQELAPLVNLSPWKPDFLTSVPLAPGRQRSRGFNQSAKIAEALSKCVQIEYREVVLKVRETKAQTGLSRSERLTNVTGSFLAPESHHGDRIILVDDVVTTGATLFTCAEALKNSGASAVFGITVATGAIDDGF